MRNVFVANDTLKTFRNDLNKTRAVFYVKKVSNKFHKKKRAIAAAITTAPQTWECGMSTDPNHQNTFSGFVQFHIRIYNTIL